MGKYSSLSLSFSFVCLFIWSFFVRVKIVLVAFLSRFWTEGNTNNPIDPYKILVQYRSCIHQLQSDAYIRFFARSVEKTAPLTCLCYSVLQVSFVLHCCVKQRTFRFEKAASRQRKIYIMKKVSCYTYVCHVATRIYLITNSSSSSSSRFAWFELLMNQLGRKMSLTQGIETCV